MKRARLNVSGSAFTAQAAKPFIAWEFKLFFLASAEQKLSAAKNNFANTVIRKYQKENNMKEELEWVTGY